MCHLWRIKLTHLHYIKLHYITLHYEAVSKFCSEIILAELLLDELTNDNYVMPIPQRHNLLGEFLLRVIQSMWLT